MIADWISPDDLRGSTDELAPSAASAASRILWSLTGRRYAGRRTLSEIYQPASNGCFNVVEAGLLAAGIAVPVSGKPYRVGPRGELFVPLNGRPARSITSVIAPLDSGEVIAPERYWIVNNAYLALSVGVPTQGGLQVTYVAGSNPPNGGTEAARALADELINLFNDCDDCRLKNVTSISRQGMSIEVEDTATIMKDGRTGIPEVDMFIESVNPGRSKTPARIFSPDAYRRVTRSR